MKFLSILTIMALPLTMCKGLESKVDSFKVFAGLCPYTSEKEGHLLVRIEGFGDKELSVNIARRDKILVDSQAVKSGKQNVVPFPLDALLLGDNKLQCVLLADGEELANAEVGVVKQPKLQNVVKIDYVRRGLVVDDLPYIPFGFYSYFPTRDVMDKEVVYGFNLYSPYHGGPHSDEKLEQIREYMDRCDALGMRVNYHAMWTSKAEMNEEEWTQLKKEIEMFRYHPALLSWYIADEPGFGVEPAHLESIYKFIKKLDPYHPITVVFCNPHKAPQYKDALDIVMLDPYPIPNSPVTMVSDWFDSIDKAFDYSKPMWIVPQAFGGHEWWRREPSAQEERVMTYLGIIHGATGIQYFIRSPEINFPKSTILWAECRKMALEVAELTPAILSTEERPEIKCEPPSVHAVAWESCGTTTILAANTLNEPANLHIQLGDISHAEEAVVLFGNRQVKIQDGVINDMIDAFGTRAYQIMAEQPTVNPENLLLNPSFEESANVGTPASCYANAGEGATYFLDSRVAWHGNHSLRISAPKEQEVSFGYFPISLEEKTRYRVSIWAKGTQPDVRFRISLAGVKPDKEEFAVTTEWKEYIFTGATNEKQNRVSAGLQFFGPGTVWFDLFQVVPVKD